MNQLKSKQIILHYSLRKTGSTYLQQHFKSKHNGLLGHGISYLGPTTFKKQLRLPCKNLQWKKNKTKLSQRLKLETITALSEQADISPGEIHKYFISFKAIFRTIRASLVQKNQEKNCNRKNNLRLYHHSQKEIKRMMSVLKHTFGSEGINSAIDLASRQQDHFTRSCNIQLRKEGQGPTRLGLEALSKICNFLHINTSSWLKMLSPPKENYNNKIILFRLENNSDQSGSIIYLDSFTLREKAKQIIPILANKSDSKNLYKTIRPGKSERGLNLAKEARLIFIKQKWKLFGRFLEKNFVQSN